MREKTVGTVYLIGAGPGDPDLITVKGKKILENADVVVYDALVNELLVARLPASIGKIFVGKRGGKPSTGQTEINRILVREARKGLRVARLKGGDALVFGRGSEEMEYLAARGIGYEVVPGITSSIAAPSYAGIPVTHRTVSRSFAVVTGHLQEGASIDELSIPEADTIVFLMAMEHLDTIVVKLIERGRFTRRTPAALIRNGTLPDQQTVVGTLGSIVSLKEKYRIKPPAVFVVGETVRFAKTLAWFKKPKLAGVRVAVLRTGEQSDDLFDGLAALGAQVLPCPIIRMVPRRRDLRKITVRYLQPFTMVIFTSPNGASLFMTQLFLQGGDARALAGKKVLAMGSGTANVLKGFGIIVDTLPEKFVAEGLLGIIGEDLAGEKVLIPRAAIAREILPDTLRKRGAEVSVLPVYDTVKNAVAAGTFSKGDYVLFTSSSTVDFFYDDPERRACAINPICIGDITAATLKKYYRGPLAIAKNATVPALLNALTSLVRSTHRKG